MLGAVEGEPLVYAENSPAANISNTITVADEDSEAMLSATIKITGNYSDNQDRLVFPANHPHLLSSYNTTTGELTLTRKNTGSDFSVGVFQEALRNVGYLNTELVNPSTALRTVAFTVKDELGLSSNPVTRNISISLVNDPPTLENIEKEPVILSISSIIQISNTIIISDDDGGDIVSATVKITQNFIPGEDILSFNPIESNFPITGVPNNDNGELTLSGNTSIENYIKALRYVNYINIRSPRTSANRLITFSVRDADGNRSNEQSRFILIGTSNAPPSIIDFEKNLQEDNELIFTANDFGGAYFDETANPIELRINSTPQHGTLEFDGNVIGDNEIGEDGFLLNPTEIGNLVYIPEENYNGTDNFKWNARDSTSFAANDAFVDIIISPINDEPVISAPSNLEVNEDELTIVPEIFVEDPDAGNGLLTVTITLDTGSISLSEISGLTFTIGDGDLDSTMEFNGTLSNINNAFNTLAYLSPANYSGSLEMQITVKDNGNSGTGGNLADIKLISIEILPVNDPPIISELGSEDLAYTENDPALQITSTLSLEDVDNPKDAVTNAIITISEGYINPGEELLTFTPSDGITGSQEENVLTLAGNASLEAYQNVLRTLHYENQSNNPTDATRTITIQVIDEKDGESNIASININVTPVNDVPVLANIEEEALPYYEGQTSVQVTSTLEANDPDAENIVGATIQISENYIAGEDSLSIDGLINLTATWDSATGTLTITGADTEAQYQNAIRSVNYHNLSENPNTAPRTISFQINDASNQSVVVFRTLTIIPNDPPVVTSFEKSTDEDTSIMFATEDFSEQYTDDNIPTEGLIEILIVSLPPNGSLSLGETEITSAQLDTLRIDAELLGDLSYIPDPNFNGMDSLSWKGSDGIKASLDAAMITITVNPVNDAPIVENFSKAGYEDTVFTFTAEEFNNHYSDVENDVMQKIIIRGLPMHGVLRLNGIELSMNAEISTGNLGNLEYAPELNFNGEDSILWSAADPFSVSDTATLALSIAPVNDAPEVASFTKTSNDNSNIPFTLADFTDHFTDVEDEELQSIVITSLPANGTLTLDANPIAQNDTIGREDLDRLVYIPNADFINGKDEFGWNASDNSLFASQAAIVNLIIGTGVSDFEIAIDEDSTFEFTADLFAANFNNANGALSEIRIDLLPVNGTLALSGAEITEGQVIPQAQIANLVYTPDSDFNGTDSLFWNGGSGDGFAPENAKITITVNPVNDAPEITTNIEDQLILVNQSTDSLMFSISDVDNDTEDLIISVTSDNEDLVPNQAENISFEIDETQQYRLDITPLADATGSAIITISVSDGNLSTEHSFKLDVYIDLLEVNAGVDIEILEGESATITAEITGGDEPFEITWTCDQDECAIDDNTQSTIQVSPLQTTTYFIEVEEAKGLIARDTITVTVTPRPTALDIPTGFTPDGVEPNNLWIIDDIEFFDNVVVEVYNRYGSQVFRSEGYSQPWDGTYNGDILPVGTYYYVVKIDNGNQVYKGSVVILR